MLQDFRFAARALRRRPGYSALTILTLALGIGANTAVFTIVDQTLLRPAPFADADRLVEVLDWDRARKSGGSSLSVEKISGWQTETAIFERFEGYTPQQFDVTGGDAPDRVSGFIVTTGLFPMLGAKAQLGRLFAPDEGRPGSPRVVVISDALWRSRFGADRSVPGRRITLNEESYEIVGVMPRRFRLAGGESIWLPVDPGDPGVFAGANRFWGLARLTRGVSTEAAQARADVLSDDMQSATSLPRGWALRLMPKTAARVDRNARTILLVLAGAVSFVLLIACANVANMLLSQTAARERESAVRSALGASRGRLVRAILVESVLTAALGGAAGVIAAVWVVQAVVRTAPANLTFMTTTTIEIDGRVLVYTAAVTLMTAVIFGLIPAIRGSRPQLERSLRASGQAVIGHHMLGKIPGGLIVVEVALALVLLVGAALMTRTFVQLQNMDTGFDGHGVLTARIELPTDRYPDEATRGSLLSELARRLKQVPGVTGVAWSNGVPPRGSAFAFGVEAEDSVAKPITSISWTTVTGEYFATLSIPIVSGRTFTVADGDDVVIVSRTVARHYWGDASPIGKRLRVSPQLPWQTVVGVVGDVEVRVVDIRVTAQMYSPFGTGLSSAPRIAPVRRVYIPRVLIVRATDSASTAGIIRSHLAALDPRQPISQLAWLEDLYADAFERERFVLMLMSIFSIVAVLLAAAGIFAVLSQSVTLRTREIGVRVAMGAAPGDIFGMIVRRGLGLTLTGVVVGTAGAAGLSRVLRSLLFGVSPYDPLSFIVVASGLVVVAFVACWLPTRRAMSIQPADALRVE
jgi:predicted permease